MGFIRRVISVTPALANVGAYVANDQVGGANEIENAASNNGGTVKLESIVIVDKEKQSAELDFFFFDVDPTLVSADNDEFELTDANMVSQCLGSVKVLATDYVTSKNSTVATKKDINFMMKAKPGTKSLFVVAVTRGTPTYVADGDLVIRFGLEQG